MKVLMFGWEFPPHISGGLGTACAGLTRALAKERVDILFTIPKLRGDEQSDNTTFLNASAIPIRQKQTTGAGPATTTPGVFAGIHQPTRRHTVAEYPQQVIEVPSLLSAYSSPAEVPDAPGLRQWNYTFPTGSEEQSAYKPGTFSKGEESVGTQSRYVKAPFVFSGAYGRNLLQEVDRYADVASEIARRNSFDVIHAHDWMTFPAGMVARKVSGKPLIVHVHATEIDRSGANVNPHIFAIEKQGMAQADKVVTVSYWTKEIAISHYGIEESKIEVIHNGITPKSNGTTYQSAAPIDSPIVTFLGRITYQKGPMYFVEAARGVHRQFPNVHFVVAGSGDQLPQMIERIAQVRLSKYFHFTGFLKGEEIDRIWALSTVYVMPSVSEPFGIAPLEAIQAGVPVILSKQAGVGEVMPHAIKVDFWDSEALAEAICNVLRYKSLANTLKKNSAEIIKTVTWDKAAKKLNSLYHELHRKHEKQRKEPRTLLPGTSAAPPAHAPLFRYRNKPQLL